MKATQTFLSRVVTTMTSADLEVLLSYLLSMVGSVNNFGIVSEDGENTLTGNEIPSSLVSSANSINITTDGEWRARLYWSQHGDQCNVEHTRDISWDPVFLLRGEKPTLDIDV